MGVEWLTEEGEAPVVHVRVTPRGGRDAIEGERDGRLRIRVSAAPADGAANESARRLIAKAAGVPRSRVALLRGARSREKSFRIEGASAAQVARSLGRQL
jgi:uncharacterized protein YggU (UPF0235/DUF167 family)